MSSSRTVGYHVSFFLLWHKSRTDITGIKNYYFINNTHSETLQIHQHFYRTIRPRDPLISGRHIYEPYRIKCKNNPRIGQWHRVKAEPKECVRENGNEKYNSTTSTIERWKAWHITPTRRLKRATRSKKKRAQKCNGSNEKRRRQRRRIVVKVWKRSIRSVLTSELAMVHLYSYDSVVTPWLLPTPASSKVRYSSEVLRGRLDVDLDPADGFRRWIGVQESVWQINILRILNKVEWR